MRQLLLEWGVAGPPSLDNFVVGRNDELAALIQRIDQRTATTLDQHFVTIWGESGAGKSHVLQALAAGAGARYVPAQAPQSAFAWSPTVTLYLLDDCDALPAEAQIAAFALYNQVRE